MWMAMKLKREKVMIIMILVYVCGRQGYIDGDDGGGNT